MAATSVGEIGLDLVVNQKQFQKQMSGINGLAKKAGAALAAAFAVKKIVSFGKECLKLGSDLSEVQNVVDVTFPSMTAQVDAFAKSAAMSFGLSETMAKRFAGTFGAMAKSFGFSEKAAYDMSSSLTGLAGDVASFYNLSQDEAYTKLKSVFTGETESLKDLGVVMTQSALDAHAMANGFGKTTQAMSESEKVALRYQFVMSKLSAAQGDFARTSDSWANQTRILKLQIDSIKATLGQGLINLFTPIIKAVNVLLGKVATLANAFKSFTELITGKKSSGQSNISSMAGIAEDAGGSMENASDSADDLSKSTGNVGAAAKKAAKEMKTLMGFDVVEKLADNTADADAGSEPVNPGDNASAPLGDAVDFGNLAEGENVIEKTNKQFDKLIKKVKQLAALFKKGFKIGFGDSEKKIQSILKGLDSIKESLKDIFASPEVLQAADNMANSITLSFGKVVGSFTSVGLTIADNLIGGFAKYLSQNKGYIKEKIVTMFDATTEISRLIGNFAAAFADVFSVFSGDTAKQCTADIIGIFSDAFLGAVSIGMQFGADIIRVITEPFVNNVDSIKTAIENTLRPISEVLSTIHQAVQDTFQKIAEVYETHVKPFLDSLSEGLTSIVNTFLEAYNTYIAPALEALAEKFTLVWNESIQPTLDKAVELLGKIFDLLKAIWENVLVPFIQWLIDNILPVVGPIIEESGKFILEFFGIVSKAFGDILGILGGFVDFLTGVFSGDNKKAWEGLQSIVESFKTGINTIFTFIIDEILTPFDTFLSNVFSKDWSENFGLLGKIANKFFDGIEKVWNDIKDIFNGIIDFINGVFSGNWSQAWEGIKTIFSGIFNGLIDIAKEPINAIISIVNGMIDSINWAISQLEQAFSFSFDIPTPFGSQHVGFDANFPRVPTIPGLAQGGWVDKNTPQLAMIGDNRHQGEVVAPEDKLKNMAIEAARAAGGSGISLADLEKVISNAVMRIVAALGSLAFYIDSEEIAKAVMSGMDSLDGRFNPVKIV